MKTEEETLCTLCRKPCDKIYQYIGKITRKMLDTLALNINFDDTNASMVCDSCQKLLQKCVDFKATCLYTEVCINSFINSACKSEVNLEDVYQMIKTERKLGNIPEGYKICRFCMKPMKDGCFTYLTGDEKAMAIIEIVTQKYIPQIALTNIREPIICDSCQASFHSYFHLISSCIDLKEKIQLDWQQLGVKEESKLANHFNDVLQAHETIEETSTAENGIKVENTDVENEVLIKTEFMDIPDAVPEYVFIKNEQLELKSEETKFESFPGSPLPEVLNENDEVPSVDTEKQKLSNAENTKTISYKCNECPYQGRSKRNLTQHMIIHKGPSQTTVFLCEKCAFSTKHRSSLTHHMLMHNPPLRTKLYKCDDCLYEATQKRYLKQHRLVHMNPTETKIYKCETCGFETAYKSSLNGHKRVHKSLLETKVHRCEKCPYVTKYKINFNRHALKHQHPSEVATLRCKLCSYETKLKEYYRQHLLVHKSSSEVATYKCGMCPYKTKRKFSLKNHQVKHQNSSEMEMHECSMCPFKTKYPGSLRRHELVHKGLSEVKMFECKRCLFETRHKKSFTRHMLLHIDSSK